MLLRVKDFASERGVSESIIYRHIRNHREELGENVYKEGKSTYITEEGQAFIRSLMFDQPVNDVIDTTLVCKIAELETKLKEKEDYIKVIEASNLLKQTRLNNLESIVIPALEDKAKEVQAQIADAVKKAEEDLTEKLNNTHQADMDNLRKNLNDDHEEAFKKLKEAHNGALVKEQSRRLTLADIPRFFKKKEITHEKDVQ